MLRNLGLALGVLVLVAGATTASAEWRQDRFGAGHKARGEFGDHFVRSNHLYFSTTPNAYLYAPAYAVPANDGTYRSFSYEGDTDVAGAPLYIVRPHYGYTNRAIDVTRNNKVFGNYR